MNINYLKTTLGKDEEIKYIPELHPYQKIPAILLIIFSLLFLVIIYIVSQNSANSTSKYTYKTQNSYKTTYNIAKNNRVQTSNTTNNYNGLYNITEFVLFLIFIAGIIRLLDVLKREYVVTNKRIITKKGIISVRTEEIKNRQVVGIYINQGISDRLNNCGTLIFYGAGGYKVKFDRILSPKQAYTTIEEIIEQKSPQTLEEKIQIDHENINKSESSPNEQIIMNDFMEN